MQIHYFQRYHSAENVHTANAMLLMSRLYSFSSGKFFQLLEQLFLENMGNFEPKVELQKKEKDSVPDAIISQPSFKIVIETKLYNNFDITQLQSHVSTLDNEEYKLLLTIDPNDLDHNTETNIKENVIAQYNDNIRPDKTSMLHHKHIRFDELIGLLRNLITDRDHDMMDIVDDFDNYCSEMGLLPDKKTYMKAVSCPNTIEFNKQNNVYFWNVDRGEIYQQYIGIYADKSIQAIGKLQVVVSAIPVDSDISDITIDVKQRHINVTDDEIKDMVKAVIKNSKEFDFDLMSQEHMYFFVDKFHDTDFKKMSLGPLWSKYGRNFDLSDVLGAEILPETAKIAGMLKDRLWE